jgi:predicted nucleic acid-binding protein
LTPGVYRFEHPHVCAGRDHPNREPSPIYLFVEVCPVVLGVALADADRAADLVCGIIRISTCDAVHAAVMLNNDVECIASFDAGFDQIAGLRRRVKLS